MQLSKIKRDIEQLKKEVTLEDTEPTLHNFNIYCRKFYHRPVNHIAEIIFIEYKRHNKDGMTISCKSDLKLYCRLSVKYFEEIHKGVIGNPVKDSTDKHSLRRWIVMYWQELLNSDNDEIMRWNTSECLESKEFQDWFETYWDYLINSDDDVRYKCAVRLIFFPKGVYTNE